MAVFWYCMHLLKRIHDKKRQAKINNILDRLHDEYYTCKACEHMDRVLQHFDRQGTLCFQEGHDAMTNYGLMHPYADSIHYLKTMKKMSQL